MATITSIETSLMNQMIAGSSIKPSNKAFCVVNDGDDWPVTFYIDSDGGLSVAQRGETGNLTATSLSRRLGLSGTVHTVSASQERMGRKRIYLAFTVNIEGIDVLHVCKPVGPSFIWAAIDTSALLQGDALRLSVRKIYMPSHVGALDEAGSQSSPRNENEFPTMYVSYQDPARPTQDVCLVDTSVSPWRFLDPQRYPQFQLTSNPETVIAMHAVTVGGEEGLIILSREFGDRSPRLKLISVSRDTILTRPQLVPTPMNCPPGATCLASYVETTGENAGDHALFVGGEDGLYHFTSEEIRLGQSVDATKISSDEAYRSPHQMLVAQSPTRISLWSLCQGTLQYQQFDTDGEVERWVDELVVPLLSCGKSTSFAATYVDGIQRLFVLESNDLEMLMQDTHTEFWKTDQFCIPTLSEFKEISSYTTVITTQPDVANPGRESPLRFQSSVQNNFFINGELRLVGSDGVVVTPDESGHVTIILPVDDLSAPIYTITPVGGGSAHTVNPMTGPNAKLGTLTTGSALKDARDVEDKAVFTGDAQSLDAAAQSLQQLRTRDADIRAGKASVPLPSVPPAPEFSVRRPWSFFKFLASKIKEAAEWGLRKVGDAVHFVIKLAGKAISFVVDTVTQVAKAISSVLETIGAGISKLLKFLGDVFNPKDYVDMQRLLCNVANHALYSAWASVDTISAAVNTQLSNVRAAAREMEAKNMPAFLRNAKIQPKRAGFDKIADVLKLINSPTGRFGQYQADHGGKGVDGGDEVGAIFRNVVENAKSLVGAITNAIAGLNTKTIALLQRDEFSLADAIVELGAQAIDGSIDVLQSIIHLFLRFFADVAAKLAMKLNKTMDIPVLSPLFKLAFGKDMTMLDAIMFIVAIPVNLVFKLVTGGKKKLSDMPSVQPLLGSGAAWSAMESSWKARSRSTTGAIGHIDTAPVDQALVWGKDFVKSTGEALRPIMPVLGPVLALIYFNYKTTSELKGKKEGGLTFKNIAGCVIKVIIFACTFPTHEHKGEKIGRVVVHWLGAVRPIASLLPNDVGGIVSAASAQAQIWGLVAIQISSYRRTGSYEIEQAVEEWLGVLGTLASGMNSVVQSTGDPATRAIVVAVTAVINHLSFGMQIATGAGAFPVPRDGESNVTLA